MNRSVLFAAAVLTLAACGPAPGASVARTTAAPAAPPPAATAPAGRYRTDPMHSSLLFRVSHMGFSHYTARFLKFDALLDFDPKNIAAMKVTARIDPKSLQTNYPEPDKLNFDRQIWGPEFLDADRFPAMTFVSTRVVQTGPDTADVTGDFTLHGVTRPVTLHVRYNGGYPGMALDPGGRIGFSARGSLKRSDFGIGFGLPAPGSNMGVFDEVEIIIETEMKQSAA